MASETSKTLGFQRVRMAVATKNIRAEKYKCQVKVGFPDSNRDMLSNYVLTAILKCQIILLFFGQIAFKTLYIRRYFVATLSMNLENTDFDILDYYSKKSFLNFIADYEKREMTLICGAGISVSAGLPSWKNYLKKIIRIFLLHWKFLEERNKKYSRVAPTEMSIAFLEDYYENSPNTELESGFFNEDPLFIAQLIKNSIRPGDWKYLLRKALYGEDRFLPPHSELINMLCSLVIKSDNIKSIITYNYDDIIELTFKTLQFSIDSIIKETHHLKTQNFPIYHPHGILPYNGGIDGKIYLSEEDYLTDIIEPNSWYNQLHSTKLTSSCCLFVGLSFNDPSLKRKLAIHKLNPNHFHYAIMTHQNSEVERKKFMLLRNELLRLNIRIIKYDYDGTHENLKKIVKLIYKYVVTKTPPKTR